MNLPPLMVGGMALKYKRDKLIADRINPHFQCCQKNKVQPPHSTNLKKEKCFFFSFRFKMTSLRPRHIGRMSGALCDLDGL
jgi:hypothetical protein